MDKSPQTIARRVLARYLRAKGNVAPDIQKVDALVGQGAFDEALTALDALLNLKLQVRVTKHSDTAHVLTEWMFALDRQDEERYQSVVESLLAVRRLLRNTPKDRLDEEVMRMQGLLDQVRHDAAWLEGVMRGQEDEFAHGPFKIILTGKAEGHLNDALKVLDEAAEKIRARFPKVLYGKVFVRSDVKGNVAGSYADAGDFITLSMYARPDRSSIHTLIHEFGHRYHTRFIDGDARDRFIELSTVGDVRIEHFSLSERRKFAEERLACERAWIAGEDFNANARTSERHKLYSAGFASRDGEFASEWRKVVGLKDRLWDGDESVVPAYLDAYAMTQYGGNLGVKTNPKAEPLAASEYGRTSWKENFAESFLAFVLGLPLPDALERFMRGLR